MKPGTSFSLRQFNIGIELIWLISMLLLIGGVTLFNYQQQKNYYYEIARADAARVQQLFQQQLDSTRNAFELIAGSVMGDSLQSADITSNLFSDLYRLDDQLQVTAILQRRADSFVFDGFSFASGTMGAFLTERLGQGGFSSFIRGYEDDQISLYYAQRVEDRNFLARVNLQAFETQLNNSVLFDHHVLLVVNRDGVVVFTSNPELQLARFALGTGQQQAEMYRVQRIGGQDWLPIISTINSAESTIVSLISADAFQRQLDYVQWTGIGVAALLLMLVLLKNLIIQRLVLQPLARIAGNLQRIKIDYTHADFDSPGKHLPREFAAIDEHMREMLHVLQAREQAVEAAAAEMLEQQRKIESILNGLPVSIAISTLDEPRKVIFTNAQFTATFGYELADIPSVHDWFEQAYPDPEYRQEIFTRWYGEVERAQAADRYVSFMEFTVSCKDGSQRDVLFSAVIVDAHLVVTMLDMTSHNATARVIASYQEALQKTAYELTENIPVGTYTMILPPGDAIAHFGFASERFLQLTGLTRAEAMENAMSAFRCVHPDDLERWVALNTEAFAEKKHFYAETRLIVQGETRWITAESSPRELPDGTLIWEGVLIDITERKLLEQELAQRQAHLRRILENLPTPIALLELDAQADISYVNHRFETLFGYALADVRADNWLTHFLPHTGDAEALLQHAQAEQAGDAKHVWQDYMVQTAAGDFLQVMLGVMRIDNTVILSFVDVTAQRELERTLLHAKEKAEQLEQAKSDFLATMSHEIRTPLSTITIIAELLNLQQVTDEQRVLLQNLETASQSLIGIVSDILDLSKIDAGQLYLQQAPFNLTDQMRQIVALHRIKANEKNLLLQEDGLDCAPLHVMGDALRFSQVLQNLLSNAVKFTESGSITVVLSMRPEACAQVVVTIRITDTGIGIAPDDLKRLFRPFVQIEHHSKRRFAGSGLGLAITQRLVDKMGGAISVESQPNIGSCFTVELPFCLADADALIPEQPSVMQSLEGMQILVIDDSEMVLNLIAQLLAGQGAQPVTFQRARPALAWLQAHFMHCDVVLMDLQMPEMDGLEATAWIRNQPQFADLPVYAFTAGVVESGREQALAAGVNDVLYKPIKLQQLVATLAQCRKVSATSTVQQAPRLLHHDTDFPVIDGIDSAYASSTTDGNRTLFIDLLGLFLPELTKFEEGIAEAIAQKNWEQLLAILHRLRGNSRMIGALDLSQAAAALENAVRAGDTDLVALQAAVHAQIQRLL